MAKVCFYNVKMKMNIEVVCCLLLLFMVSLCCDAAEAKQGMSLTAQKFEVQKHLNRLNKPAIKSIKVKPLYPFYAPFFVCLFLLMVSFGNNNRAQMVILLIVFICLINQLLIILCSRITLYRLTKIPLFLFDS